LVRVAIEELRRRTVIIPRFVKLSVQFFPFGVVDPVRHPLFLKTVVRHDLLGDLSLLESQQALR
jgi:hypothetical protein